MTDFRKRFLVKPGQPLSLDRIDPADRLSHESKAAAREGLDMRFPGPGVDSAQIQRKYHAAVKQNPGSDS